MNFDYRKLRSLTESIFQAAGCAVEEARRVSARLIDSNLVGHDSHGVIRIPSYVSWLQEGKVHAGRSVKTELENDAIAVLDGQFGLGQTIGEQAIELAIRKSASFGVAVVALRNSGHLGRIGDWAELAAAAGKISLHFVNTSGAGMLVAPFGGIDRRLSANPIAVGVPTQDGPPLILDISTSTVAEGKVRVALNEGKQLPDGCIIDAEGRPTNDPETFYGQPPGAILPIAHHKGSGLALMIEMLAGALTGGSCSSPQTSRVANGMLSIVIDPDAFASPDDFFPEVQRYVDFVKSSRTVTPDGEILMPGELEHKTRAVRQQQGIELDARTWQQICVTCDSLGIEHDFPKPSLSEAGERPANLSIPGCDPSSSDSEID